MPSLWFFFYLQFALFCFFTSQETRSVFCKHSYMSALMRVVGLSLARREYFNNCALLIVAICVNLILQGIGWMITGCECNLNSQMNKNQSPSFRAPQFSAWYFRFTWCFWVGFVLKIQAALPSHNTWIRAIWGYKRYTSALHFFT
jgi:hypothetical protein